MNDFDRLMRHLDQDLTEPPSLPQLSRLTNLPPAQLRRLLARWGAISPEAFVRSLTREHRQAALRQGAHTLKTCGDFDESATSRNQVLPIQLSAESPHETDSRGTRGELQVGFAETPFGTCLLADSPRGICQLTFVDQPDRAQAEKLLRHNWPRTTLRWGTEVLQWADRLFSRSGDAAALTAQAHVRGTAFQIRVWRTLLRIPPAQLVSYGAIAKSIGLPGSARAVGQAVGSNRLAYLIPCHRVIPQSGIVGHYRWGTNRKRAMLAWETAPTVQPAGSEPDSPNSASPP